MKKLTSRDPYPIVGVCNVVSARGRCCVLPAGHDVKGHALHRNGRGSPFVEVIDWSDVKDRRKRPRST